MTTNPSTKAECLDILLKLSQLLAQEISDPRPAESDIELYRIKTLAVDVLNHHQCYQSWPKNTSPLRGMIDSQDKRLSIREARAVSLRDAGYNMAEIANLMGITTGTVKVHLSSARKKVGLPAYAGRT